MASWSRRRVLQGALLLPLTSLTPLLSARTVFAEPEPARAEQGMVATAEPLASRVGVEILRRGGNAVDAAVAVAFALAVTFPEAGNLGGGGFLLFRRRDGFATALDYRETAPAAATHDVYLDKSGNVIAGAGGPLLGYRAAGVPGTVAGMRLAFEKYSSGKLDWHDLLEPARQLAADGFVVPFSLANALRDSQAELAVFAETRRVFFPGGNPIRAGERLRQPDLARTIARLQQTGGRDFYTGETAQRIARDMAAHNGLITQKDLAGYQARERTPLRGRYRDFGMITMPPPSSGGIALLNMLGILEGFDSKMLADPLSAQRLHVLVEAMRRAFADRAHFLGDTDFVTVPVAALLSREYAVRRRATIDPARATPSSRIQAGVISAPESSQTTHLTIVDQDGNAVSNTYTLNGGFGSGVVAAGTGVLLNNEMDDFAAKPGVPNLYGLMQSENNAVAPGKRPLSSMTPTFVERPDGSLYLALGSPGGPTIINTVLQIIVNVIDGKLNLRQAVDAPRVHHQWLPDEIVTEPLGLSPETRATLSAMGHHFAEPPHYLGNAQAVMIHPETKLRYGASDRRGSGLALGY